MLRIVSHYLLLIGLYFVSSITQAGYFTSEPTAADAADGSYTITWARNGADVGRYDLWETLPSGSRSKAYSGTGKSKIFTGKANGTYKYELYSLREDFSNPYEPDIRWMRTDTLTLVVDKIVIPPTMSKPAAPSTDSDRKIYVSWSASTGKSITRYQLYVNKSGSSTWGQAYIGSGRAFTYTASSDGTYNFKVRAYNAAGWGGFSSTDSTITSARPSTPASISAPSVDYDGSVYVSWGAATGTVDKYQLYQQANGGSWALVYDNTGRSRTSTLADGKYKFKVRACNNESSFVNCTAYKESGYSYVVRTPGVPTSISGVPSSTTSKSITVSWGASSGTIKRYELQQSYNGGSFYNIYTSTGRSKSTSLGLGTYKYRVRACNEVPGKAACSGYRTSNVMTVTLPSPLSFSAVASTSPIGTIKLNWRGVAEATSYTLQESKNSGGWVAVSSSLSHTILAAPGEPVEYFGSYSRTGRTTGTYKYRLQACKGSICSAWRTSGTVSVVFPPTKPSSITVPTSTVTNGTVAISWPGSSNATYYKLQEKKNSGSWVALTNSTASLSYSRAGRMDASYTYRVTACNTSGCDAIWRTSSLVIVILPPIIPSTFSASASTTIRGNVSLSWGSFSTVLDADTYTVQQSKNNGSWTTVSSTLRHSVLGGNNGEPIEYYGHHTVTGLANGSYQYRLKACKSTTVCTGWKSSGSITVLLPPTIPSSITVPTSTVTNGTVAISWPASSNATYYKLQEKKNSGSWVALTNSTTSLSYSRTGRTDASYTYRVTACNTSGCDATWRTSSLVIVILPPILPAFSASASTTTRGNVSLSWGSFSTVLDADTYTVQQSKNNGSWTTVSSTLRHSILGGGNGEPIEYYGHHTVTGLADGSYQYRLKACKSTTICTGWRNSSSVTVLHPPSTPLSITLPTTTSTNGSIAISWTSSSTATKYELQESVNSGSWITLTSMATATSYSRTSRPNGSYKYQVRAYNTSGWSGYRASGSVTVLLPPSAPSSITVPTTTSTNGSIAISWTSSSTATKYELQESVNSGSWITLTSTATTTSYSRTGRPDGSYKYQVRAYNTSGWGGYRASGNVTVLLPAPVPASITVPTATVTNGSINVSWGVSSSATKYELQESANEGAWVTLSGNIITNVYPTISGRANGSYRYRVRAYNNTGWSAYRTSSIVTVLLPPLTPWSINVPALTSINGTLYINWSKSETAIKYELQESVNGGEWHAIPIEITTLYLTRSDLLDGSYKYQVRAYNNSGWSGYLESSTVDVHLPLPAPASITVPSSTVMDGEIDILWAEVSGALKYTLQESKNNGDWEDITNIETSTGYHLSERGYGAYKYQVNAYNGTSWGAYKISSTVDVSFTSPTPLNIDTAPAPQMATTPAAVSVAVGSISAGFKVDESGAATYSVPLSLPRGIAGVTPSIGLNYSSAASNGSLGMGWNISGLSSISRCRQTQEQDGNTAALTLTNNDRFCLDGQKLLAVEGSYGENNTGYRTEIDSQTRITSYGSSGAGPAYFVVERTDGSTSYYGNTDASSANRTDSTLIANDDTIINWLITSTNDNMNNADNIIYFNYLNDAVGYGESEIVIESISYSGNSVNFVYRNDSNSSFERSDKAFGYLYGKKVSSKALLDDIIISNHNSIAIRSYHLGYENDTATNIYRINSLQQCNGSTTGACIPATTFDWHEQAPVVSYGTPNSLDLGSDVLKAVQPFDLDGDGYNDLAFVVETLGHYELYMSYNDNGTLQAPSKLDSFSVLDNAPITLFPMDIDGDSHLEIIYYRAYAGKNKWASYDIDDHTVKTIQDGRTGINHTSSNFIQYLNIDTTQTGNDVLFHDVNADAYPDMIYRFNGKNYIAINNQGTFSSPEEVSINMPGKYSYASSSCSSSDCYYSRNTVIDLPKNIAPSDFNNDGQADILLRMADVYRNYDRGGDVYLYYWMAFSLENSGSGYVYEPIAAIPNSHKNTSSMNDDVLVSDVNGDGLGDVLYQPSGVSYPYRLYFSTGTGFDEETSSAFTPVDDQGGQLQSEDVLSLQFVDLNKDGQQDVIYFNKVDKQWQVHYRDGSEFGQSRIFGHDSSFNENADNVLVGDWDADGNLDIARIDYANKAFYYSDNIFFVITAGNRLHTITNGLGLKTVVDYELMTNPEVYTKGASINGIDTEDLSYGRCPVNGCSPVFDLVMPSYIVSQVTSDAPGWNAAGSLYDADNTVAVSYHYKGLRIQSGGRGMLGFEKITSYDPQKGVSTETLYRQDFPYIGMPKATVSYLGEPQTHDFDIETGSTTLAESIKLKHAINTYGLHKLNTDSIYSPYLAQSSEAQYTINSAGTATTKQGRVVTDNTLNVYSDNYTNSDTIVATTYAGTTEFSRITTTNTYTDDDVSKWWLGRLSTTDVTHFRPSAEVQNTISRSSTFDYDTTSGMLFEEKVDLGTDGDLTTLHCFDEWGNETKTIAYANVGDVSCSSQNIVTKDNPNKVFRRKVTTFDDAGRYVVSQGNDRFTSATINSRNELGQVTQTTDVNGVVTNTAFDSYGRKYFTSNSLGQSTTIERRLPFNGSNALFTENIITAGQPRVINHINRTGQIIRTDKRAFDNNYIVQRIYHDAYGRIVKQSLPHYLYSLGDTVYWNTNRYDDFGRITSTSSADSTLTKAITYNGLSTQTTVTTSDSYATSQSKTLVTNVLAETVSVTDNAGTLSYYYNAVGNLAKVTGVDDQDVITSFDDYGRKVGMDDPDKGVWSYSYNNLGELIGQTNAKLVTTTFYRDSVGRTVQRILGSEVTDYKFVGHQLDYETITSGSRKDYAYDIFGRANGITTTIDGQSYSQSTTFDQYGRVFQQFDAVGDFYGIQNVYNSYGYLQLQKEARNGASTDASVFYQIMSMDALGNVTHFEQNNGRISSTKNYNQANGNITSISADNGAVIQNNVYVLDSLGNLRSRTRNTLKAGTLGQNETFDYDNLNRLTHVNDEEEIKYYANGNISWKHDVGYYCYNNDKPHAVSGIGSNGCSTQDYQYDNNGNMTSGRGRTIGYSEFDKATSIVNNQGNTAFSYDASRARYKRITTDNSTNITTTTYYVGNVEVESKSNSTVVTMKRYLPNAIELQRSNNTREINFLHKDHLGSIDTITDERGFIKQKLYFDAWGKKQLIDSGNMISSLASYTTLSLNELLDISARGYTGHESVDHADIIHMNGRIYDPTLGRFLQADPIIQEPNNSQSYNRYSYVINNPLSLTDPTGYFFSGLKKLVKKYWKVVVAAVVVYFTAGAASGWVSTWGATWGTAATTATATTAATAATLTTAGSMAVGAMAGAAGGFVGGALTTGSFTGALKGALVGAFTGAAFGGVNGYYGDTWNMSRVGSTTMAGGLSSKVAGGNFANGAKFAFAAAMMRYGYNKAVKYDATWESGGAAEQKGLDTPPIAGANNIGTQGGRLNPDGWFNEGGIVSRGANHIPGVNGVSGIHDVFQVELGQVGGWARNVFNVPGMIPATVMTYGALMTDLHMITSVNNYEWGKRHD